MLVACDEAQTVLTATENGYGKRTPIAEYTRHGRGTQGMIAIQASERNGKLIGAVLVDEHDELILVSTGGVLIRTEVSQIREMGRSTQGVNLIHLDEGTKLAGIEKVLETEDEGLTDSENGASDDARDAQETSHDGATDERAAEDGETDEGEGEAGDGASE
jgi:DNA gyrase subunit A